LRGDELKLVQSDKDVGTTAKKASRLRAKDAKDDKNDSILTPPRMPERINGGTNSTMAYEERRTR